MAVLPDYELLHELLDYNPESGELTWKWRDRRHFSSPRSHARWNGRYAGKPAENKYTNCVSKYECFRTSIFNKKYIAHRVIWKMVTGQEPPAQIDHIDQNPLNNAWANLRAVDNATNRRNLPMSRFNTSGHTGVHWDKARCKWFTQINVDGKRVALGRFKNFSDAVAAVEAAKVKAGYTPQHGRRKAHYAK